MSQVLVAIALRSTFDNGCIGIELVFLDLTMVIDDMKREII